MGTNRSMERKLICSSFEQTGGTSPLHRRFSRIPSWREWAKARRKTEECSKQRDDPRNQRRRSKAKNLHEETQINEVLRGGLFKAPSQVCYQSLVREFGKRPPTD